MQQSTERDEDGTDRAYQVELERARAADLSDLEDSKVVQVVWNDDECAARDRDGNVLVVVIPALLPKRADAWEQMFQLFVRETDEICGFPFRVVYVLSGLRTWSGWMGWWVRGAWQRLSRQHQSQLSAMTVVHPTVATRVLMLGAGVVLGRAIWEKVEYADRVEEIWLDGVMSREMVEHILPQGVWRFERALVEDGEEERRNAIRLGAPLTAREVVTTLDGDGDGRSSVPGDANSREAGSRRR